MTSSLTLTATPADALIDVLKQGEKDHLMPPHDAMFFEPSPGPVKYAASLLGMSTDEVRLPMMAATF